MSSIDILTEAVRATTGLKDAAPRPGQARMAADVGRAITASGHAVGIGPTGVGKSFGLLAPAFEAAALHGKRAILSTESLSLQAQILDKDAPVVAAATKKATGKDVTFAVLKGFGNYACHSKAAATAANLGDEDGIDPARLRSGLRHASIEGQLWVDGTGLERADLIPLVQWALEQDGDDQPGDRHSYSGRIDDALWRAVSVTTSECLGADCPFAELCRPQKSREKAAHADIVVTNHAMLAVQAATGTPVAIGNRNLGWFDSVIVDEAHALPSAVRSHGAAEISPRRIRSAVKSMKEATPDNDKTCAELRRMGSALSDTLSEILSGQTRGLKAGETRALVDGDDPLAGIGEDLSDWAKICVKALKERAGRSTPREALSTRRAATVFEGIAADLRTVRTHRPGVARWLTVEEGPNGVPMPVLAVTPVDVAGLLKRNLWTAEAPLDEEDELAQAAAEAGEPEEQPRVPLAAVCVSATLPAGFPREAGLDAAIVHYESPFDAAYGASRLFIPKPTPQDTAELYPGAADGRRPKFDPGRHQAWAARVAADLVDANLGAALVLSANSTAGKAYAEALRRAAKGRWRVLSQWDGRPARQLVQEWRDDESCVLVGTKSLMTGVDAKGRTCSLVIVDRVPRAAGNPVDDARSEAIQARLDTDRWSADRLVYSSDAALLLEQALGRLIRSVTDQGLAAILDPRLLPGGPVAYPAPTRKVYEAAYTRFENLLTSQAEAEDFLRRLAARHASLEAA